ncbi:response regulator transcription factor [Formicincola oecophyllae]|uniref:Response regulator transcription factor n=1 Tax=Formicincola oecophyllae TaxID=2558361 RepID=A0A4Y6U9X6_9PROT|nr:response regulator transcription factor [Formicincola oecophyllae]QDH13171.1 response regulator transcription factor [Formicincola oecophyllae]
MANDIRQAPSVAPSPQGTPNAVKVLLVEDDETLAHEIQVALAEAGYQVLWAADGPTALEMALGPEAPFSVMIMDRMLPGLDGLSVLAQLRARDVQTPVLVLSALSAVDDRINGLHAGGDDYLTKPFAMGELSARLAALLRRPVETRQSRLRVGPLEMDLIERTVSRDGREIELLPREFKLLEYMMRRPGAVLTRTMFLEDVWHYRFVPQTNLVDVHIGKLRRKVDGAGEDPMIESIRGAGFRLNIPEAPPAPAAHDGSAVAGNGA